MQLNYPNLQFIFVVDPSQLRTGASETVNPLTAVTPHSLHGSTPWALLAECKCSLQISVPRPEIEPSTSIVLHTRQQYWLYGHSMYNEWRVAGNSIMIIQLQFDIEIRLPHYHLHALPPACTTSCMHCRLHALPPAFTTSCMHYLLHALPPACNTSCMHYLLHSTKCKLLSV